MNACFHCDRPAQHRHHVVPVSLVGWHERTVPLCADCHSLVHHSKSPLSLANLRRIVTELRDLYYRPAYMDVPLGDGFFRDGTKMRKFYR
jgi:hypothetical protein